MTRIFLVRHGENPANITREFSCRLVDYSLTAKGRLQAEQTAEFLVQRPLQALFSSPLLRARETAEPLGQRLKMTVTICEEFREMDVGDLESMSDRTAAWGKYRDVMRAWLSGDPSVTFPGGENRTSLVARFERGLQKVAADHPQGEVAIVGHGGIFTHGVVSLCRVSDEREFFSRENHNSSVSEILVDLASSKPTYTLVHWASTAHLSGEAALLLESVPEEYRVRNL